MQSWSGYNSKQLALIHIQYIWPRNQTYTVASACSNRERLAYYAEIQIFFGTVYLSLLSLSLSVVGFATLSCFNCGLYLYIVLCTGGGKAPVLSSHQRQLSLHLSQVQLLYLPTQPPLPGIYLTSHLSQVPTWPATTPRYLLDQPPLPGTYLTSSLAQVPTRSFTSLRYLLDQLPRPGTFSIIHLSQVPT